MKKLLLSLLVVFAAAGSYAQTAGKGYTISGTSEGTVDGDTVYLADMQGFFNFSPVDTCIVKAGKFNFTGSYDGAAMRFVLPVHAGKALTSGMFILENCPITMQLFPEESGKKNVINGGVSNDLYNAYQAAEIYYGQFAEPLYTIIQDSTKSVAERNAAQAKADSITAATLNRNFDYIMCHIGMPISDMFLGFYYSEFSESQLNAILSAMAKAPVQYGIYKAIIEERAATAATAIGKKYTDIVLQNAKGKTIKISDYVSKNKYTLIDFWASWCGPCRAEMPNVVKAYSKHHKKGFEVVGVSLDNNKAAWVKAVNQLKMPWPQMSDLKGWASEGAKAYNIKAIPSNVLVDKNGTIVAKDLREEALQTKLDELFK